MFLQEKNTDHVVEVLNVNELFNPFADSVNGRYHMGEEMGDAMSFRKTGLAFQSGEALPRCWSDPDYRAN